jgi:elongator complex protein 6
MPSQPVLPYTLIPYVSSPPPDESLTLITAVLGATSNWLILRFLYTALVDHDRRRGGGQVSSNDEFADSQNTTTARANWKVVLVSFLRDLGFWKTEAKRLVCIPLYVYIYLSIRNIFACLTNLLANPRASIFLD